MIKACSSHSLGKLYEEPEMAPHLETFPSLLQILNVFSSVNTEFLQWSPNSSYYCQIAKLLPFPPVGFFLWYADTAEKILAKSM